MTKPTANDSPRLDDELAEFTDQVLSGKSDDAIPHSHQDPELIRLEKTVLRLKAAFGPPAQPPQAAAQRIRQHLAQQWRLNPQAPRTPAAASRAGWLARLGRLFGWSTPRRRQRTLSLAFSVIAVVALLAMLILSPEQGSSLPATAGRLPAFLVFVFFAVAALVILVVDLLRKP